MANDAPATVNNNQATVNDRTGLYISIIALAMAALSLGLTLREPSITDAKIEGVKALLAEAVDKARTAENHWRNDEVDIRALQSDMKKLEADYARTKH